MNSQSITDDKPMAAQWKGVLNERESLLWHGHQTTGLASGLRK